MRQIQGQEWDVCESNSVGAVQTVLLLPGGMCTAGMFAEVMDALVEPPVRAVAATLPGFGRTPHPEDLTLENYAALAGALATEIGADALVGHSLGANVALEMVASGAFTGPTLLLSRSFSSQDEYKELRILDRVGRLPGIGRIAWLAALKVLPRAVPKSIPAPRRDAVASDLGNNDAGFCQAIVRAYFEYLDRNGNLVPRLCGSATRVHVAFGDHDEVGLTDGERAGLIECGGVTLTTVDDATHFLIAERPERVAELILDLVDERVRA